jgi:hypothetical protein
MGSLMDLSLEAVASDAAVLKSWTNEQSWDVFNRYLEKIGEDFQRRAMNFTESRSQRQDDYEKGVLAGLRMAQQIPENVAGWAKVAAEKAKLIERATKTGSE